ncbi:hypothetical protein GJ496_002472 [Pomphorhynchus laevis]|nr:hypothetical protein GJ496_002472 [Pomphorhynchus laevis]
MNIVRLPIMILSRILGIAACIAVPLIGAKLSSNLIRKDIYTLKVEIKKPKWTPPKWMFEPVWTILYVIMGYASWLILSAPSSNIKLLSIGLYCCQLLLNWSFFPIYIRLKLFRTAGIVLLLLDINVVSLIFSAWFVDRKASLLLLPYLGWISFVTALNWTICSLNPKYAM